jgi:UDP-glucose 4-epimerase
MNKKILVTGGAGYIGSHACLEILQAGFDLVVVDNLINSSREALRRVEKLAGKKIKFHKVDLREEKLLDNVFASNTFDSVIHFAGLKAVGESVKNPLLYYDNNVNGSITLFKLMQKHGVEKLVFSSSACVYGEPKTTPITEDFPIKPLNPYGQTKAIIEQIVKDINISDKKFKVIILRYFNPVGAHESGLIGEDPRNIPNNLVPYIAQVAVGRLNELSVFGGDYNTPDGTGVRDYIHVVDLAKAHVKAIEKLDSVSDVEIYNLGTGRGCSVLEVIRSFEKASGKKIAYKIVARRPGDSATVFTDPSLANFKLNWKAKKNIDQMCEDVWNWQSKNPKGFLE